jgi:hypothetical protein
MMTEYEARELAESMHRELNAGPRAVWQCVAGLLVFIGVVLLGTVFPTKSSRAPEAANTTVGRQNPVSYLAPASRAATEAELTKAAGNPVVRAVNPGDLEAE